MSEPTRDPSKSKSDASDPSTFPRDVYELLDHARSRPGMYGIGGKSFRLLEAFLGGLSWTALDGGTPSLWDFPMWVGVCMGGLNPSAPLLQMKLEHTDDAAYELWFDLLEQYRKCRVVELARLPATVLRSMPYPYAKSGVRIPALVPDWICIGQYAGSTVFFLGESNEGRFIRHDFELTDSLEKIFREAQRRWQVATSVWGTVEPCDDPHNAAIPGWAKDLKPRNRIDGTGAFPRDMYELLDYARNRPSLYGIGAKSYRLLQSFLGGLACGNLPEGRPSLWEFKWWAAAVIDEGESSMPLHTLKLERTDDLAYKQWFDLLDEYRKCSEVELARLAVSASPRTDWGYIIGGDGPNIPIEPPDWLLIGRFTPSDVHFLAQIRDGVVSKHYSFQSSLEQAFDEAYRWWAVDSYQWQLDASSSS